MSRKYCPSLVFHWIAEDPSDKTSDILQYHRGLTVIGVFLPTG